MSEFQRAYADVLGVKVSAVNLTQAIELADEWIAVGSPGYVCATGVHGVMEAQSDLEFRQILNGACINAPDGMPMTWVGRLQGFGKMDRVFGPDFMAAMCRLSVERGYRNFLYGGKPGVAELLSETLQRKFPGLQVVGTYTPPFRSLTPNEEDRISAQVLEAKPHILWVGLSTPKQERFMAQFVKRLQVPLLVGVGAAFDFVAGTKPRAPLWMQRSGFEWLFRLMMEPRRLAHRYLVYNTIFVVRALQQVAGWKSYARDS